MENDNRARARQFLMQHFHDEELNNICFDYFPQVYNEFATGMPKGAKVRLLVESCDRGGRMADLLAALQRERPSAYDTHFTAEPLAPTPEIRPIVRNPRQVFLSHASQDANFVRRLAQDLRDQGWEIWLAPDSIRPGEKWVEAINRGLAESGVFVLVLSEAAVNSRWVHTETNAAIGMEHRSELRFIPISLEDVNAPAVWQAYQWIPFDENYKSGLENLLTILQPDKMAELRRLYGQLQQAVEQEEWSQVEDVGGRIQDRYPDYRETARLLNEARQQVEQERLRRARAEQLYSQLQVALTNQNWEEVLKLAEQLQKIEPAYRDVENLVEEARQGQINQQQRERRQAQQAEAERLYSQLQEAMAAESWDRALDLVKQIEAQVKSFRDVPGLAKVARQKQREVQRRRRAEQPPLRQWLRRLPPIAWAGAVGGLSLVLLIIFWLDGNPEPMVTPTEMIAAQTTRTETPTAAPTDEPVAVNSTTPTPALLTQTPSPVPATATSTMTATVAPTVDLNVPPADAELGSSWTRPIDDMVMVYVPPPDAPFVLESGVDAPTDGFWIDKYEVSNAQYQLCVDAGACEPSAYVDDDRFNGAEYPVVGVSAFDADAYSEWVGGALPTEAQWEYAAVGNSGFEYPWGDEFDGTRLNFCDVNCEYDWREGDWDDGYQYTSPTNSFPDSGSWVGALNMSGNVWEWTASWYDEQETRRVLRGGSWVDDAYDARAASRGYVVPGYRGNVDGFRVVVRRPPSP